MAGRPLRPATDRRLGEPLPHQLANLPSAAPIARGPDGSPAFIRQVVCGISYSFRLVIPHYRARSDVLLTRSPLATRIAPVLPFDLHV